MGRCKLLWDQYKYCRYQSQPGWLYHYIVGEVIPEQLCPSRSYRVVVRIWLVCCGPNVVMYG